MSRRLCSLLLGAGLLGTACHTEPAPSRDVESGIRVERMYVVLSFDSSEGDVMLILPSDAAAGDLVSAHLSASASPDDASQSVSPGDPHADEAISVEGQVVPVSAGAVVFRIPLDSPTVPIRLLDAKGGALGQADYPVSQVPVTARPAPGLEWERQGHLIYLSGTFDGDLTTTRIDLDGEPVDAWAESPRRLMFPLPWTASGLVRVRVGESGLLQEVLVPAIATTSEPQTVEVVAGQVVPVLFRACGWDEFPREGWPRIWARASMSRRGVPEWRSEVEVENLVDGCAEWTLQVVAPATGTMRMISSRTWP